MPENEKEISNRDPGKQLNEAGKPGSEKRRFDQGTRKTFGLEETNPERGEGKKARQGQEEIRKCPKMKRKSVIVIRASNLMNRETRFAKKEGDLTKEPGKPSDSEETNPEKGEGKRPVKDKEGIDSQMPENEKEISDRDPGKQLNETGKPGREKDDDLTKELENLRTPRKAILKKQKRKSPVRTRKA